MNNPLVSIIVPVYNAQDSVARCLESICNQTWKNLEIIVLNDGSKDNSLTICQQFREKDPRILVVDKENEGLSLTRNVGLTHATGKYVQFVDSDDHIALDFTERMVTAAEEHDAELVISPYWMEIPLDVKKEQAKERIKLTEEKLRAESARTTPPVSAESAAASQKAGKDLAKKKLRKKKAEVEFREYGFLDAGVYDQKDYALHLMEKPVTFFYNVVWNKIYRRDILTAHDLHFTNEMLHAEDQQFNIRYLEFVHRVVSLADPGYYYVQNPQSICHTQINLSTILQNRLQMMDYYKDLYTKLGLYEEVQTKMHTSLVAFAENSYPTLPIQKVLGDAAQYWYAFFAGSEEEAQLAAERSGKKSTAPKRKKKPKPRFE